MPLGRSGEVSAFSSAAQVRPTIFYLGQWVAAANDLGDPVWEPQFPVDHWVDVRDETTAAPALIGQVDCCLLAVNDEPVGAPWMQLSASVGSLTANLRSIEILAGFPIGSLAATTFGELAFEMLVEDALIVRNRKPLAPNRNLIWNLRMGEVQVFSRYVYDEPDAWDATKRRINADYARLRDLSLANGDDLYRKYLATEALRYRIDYRDLLYGLPDEGTRQPETTITESWGCGDSDDPDCDLDWVEVSGGYEIVSNEAHSQGISNLRANSSLSSDDHYSEAALTNTVSGTHFSGVIVRFDTSAETFYVCKWRDNASATFRITEYAAGSEVTVHASVNDTAPGDGPHEVQCDINGSDIEMFFNSVSVATASDGTITGNLQGGLHCTSSSSGRCRADDYEGSDGGAAAANRRVIIID